MELQHGLNPRSRSVLEQFELRAESQSTFTAAPMKAMTALGILLLAAQSSASAMVARPATEAVQIRDTNQESGQTIGLNEFLSHQKLVSALIAFHDAVVASQEDLPPAALEVLYVNLWELYE